MAAEGHAVLIRDMMNHPNHKGQSKKEFNAALKGLVDKGLVERAGWGRVRLTLGGQAYNRAVKVVRLLEELSASIDGQESPGA